MARIPDADAVAPAVHEAVARHREPGALLPILHDLQDRLGCIPPAAIAPLASELNLSRADVYGVVTFYPDLHEQPRGARVVRLCQAEACQAVGARELAAHASARLGIPLGATTPDGHVSLDEVFCLGNCALGPSAQVDGVLHGRVDAARLDALVETP